MRRWLDEGAQYSGMLDAAGNYADPTLLPLLEVLRADADEADSWWVQRLERAIEACGGD